MSSTSSSSSYVMPNSLSGRCLLVIGVDGRISNGYKSIHILNISPNIQLLYHLVSFQGSLAQPSDGVLPNVSFFPLPPASSCLLYFFYFVCLNLFYFLSPLLPSFSLVPHLLFSSLITILLSLYFAQVLVLYVLLPLY